MTSELGGWSEKGSADRRLEARRRAHKPLKERVDSLTRKIRAALQTLTRIARPQDSPPHHNRRSLCRAADTVLPRSPSPACSHKRSHIDLKIRRLTPFRSMTGRSLLVDRLSSHSRRVDHLVERRLHLHSADPRYNHTLLYRPPRDTLSGHHAQCHTPSQMGSSPSHSRRQAQRRAHMYPRYS